MKLTFISLAYTPSVKNQTQLRKTLRRAEKNKVQCFRACVDLILSMHGFLTDGLPHRRSFFSIQRKIENMFYFFTDGKQTDGAHTRSVCLMKTDRWTVFIGQTDHVWAPSFFFPLVKKNRTCFKIF